MRGGILSAWDPATQKERWFALGGGQSGGGTLSLASNLVFQTMGNGRMKAFTADKGEQLLDMALPVTSRPARTVRTEPGTQARALSRPSTTSSSRPAGKSGGVSGWVAAGAHTGRCRGAVSSGPPGHGGRFTADVLLVSMRHSVVVAGDRGQVLLSASGGSRQLHRTAVQTEPHRYVNVAQAGRAAPAGSLAKPVPPVAHPLHLP